MLDPRLLLAVAVLLLLAGQTTPAHAFRAASSVRSTERSTSAKTTSARGGRRGLRQRIRGLRGRLTSKHRRARVKRPAPIRAKIKTTVDSTLGSLGRHLRRSDAGNEGAARQNLRQRCTAKMQRLGHCVMEGARKLGRGIKNVKPKQVVRKVGLAVKKGAKWSKAHPGKALGIGLGTCAMFATAFCVAPALSAGVAGCLAPTIGQTAASVVGTATGGALACGARSLLVHSTPMVLGVDPFNARQLGTDVSLSSTFGFFGFAQAAFLKSLGAGLGLSGMVLFGANAVGLIGYEIGKDYLQNRIRNRVASDPKSFKQIWKSSLLMETASNLHRCIPGLGLETNFGAKIIGDLGGTIWWDRIVNSRNADKAKAGQPRPNTHHVHDALTE